MCNINLKSELYNSNDSNVSTWFQQRIHQKFVCIILICIKFLNYLTFGPPSIHNLPWGWTNLEILISCKEMYEYARQIKVQCSGCLISQERQDCDLPYGHWTLSGLCDSQSLRFVKNVRTQNQEKYSKNICKEFPLWSSNKHLKFSKQNVVNWFINTALIKKGNVSSLCGQ